MSSEFVKPYAPIQEVQLRTVDRTLTPIWRDVSLGVKKTGLEYVVALDAASHSLRSSVVRDLLNRLVPRRGKIKISLVKFSPVKFGFQPNGTYVQLLWWADVYGLRPCPPEVGPSLRLAYVDQPSDEKLFVAMKPVADQNGVPRIFMINGTGLDAVSTCSQMFSDPKSFFVFRTSR